MKLMLFFVAATAAGAASISGHVRDASGRIIPGSRVTVLARDNGVRLTAWTDATGGYRVEPLGAGEYLVEAEAPGMAPQTAKPVTLTHPDTATADFTLSPREVRQEVVVTATGTAQSTGEIAKAVDVVDMDEASRRALSFVAESVRSLPGVRVTTLGGPGAFTQIVIRGLRQQDTAVTIDGLRFRDAATTQGDATPFLEDLLLVNPDRIEVLRGTGSSIYGSNAIGGVVNVVTDEGGAPLHGEVKAEGGGLGMMRGLARVAGGTKADRLRWSAGLQHMNVTRGVDGDDRFRNASGQGSVQLLPASTTSLTARVWASDSFTQLNSSPYAAPASLLPPHGVIEAVPVPLDVQHRIEAGLPFSFGGANLVPALDDPDSRRSGRFLSGALVLRQQLSSRVSVRASYHKVITRRWYDDGPAGVRFEPLFNVSDRIRGGIDTVQGRVDAQLARWNLLSAGYEFEIESYRSIHLDFGPPALRQDSDTSARQRSHSAFFQDELRLLGSRLHVSFSGRVQEFALDKPAFSGPSLYQGLTFQSPPMAKTGDIAAAYFLAHTNTKLRAHVGNGYRAPSIYERFGASFYDGQFSSLGDPRLRPDRTVAFDGGLDQFLAKQRVRVSATYFYTNLQEVIAFDFSGFLRPATDPFGRSSGYINTGGGIARGVELGAEASPMSNLRLTAAYTYTNGDLRRSTVRDRDFFKIPSIPANQFTAIATERIGRRLELVADIWISGAYPIIFSSRAFLLSGARKVDAVANYTVPVSDRTSLRFYGKLSNVFDSKYLEGGFRTPGRWGIGGVSFQF